MKYLVSLLLAFWALVGSAQDIPERSALGETIPPPKGLLRPVYLKPLSKLVLMDSKGNQVELDAQRRPKLFNTWPPYLITNPVLGDQAMGPSLTADTSQRQYAVFNGNRWVEFGPNLAENLTFGKGFSKAGTTINLNQYPNSLGDILADRLSLSNAPAKTTNPSQHSFLLFNPTTGQLERLPYVDLLSSGGVPQWPSSLGNVGVDRLYFATVPDQISAENLNLMNARFLMNLGNTTVQMSMGEYKVMLEKAFGLSGGSALTWVPRPDNQNSPGALGHVSYDPTTKKWYMYGRNGDVKQWFRWNAEDQFTNSPLYPSGDTPTLTGQYNPATTKINLNWNTNLTTVQAWDVFASYADSLHYNLEASNLAAGLRSYDLQTYGPATYYVKIRGVLGSGLYTPFSKQLAVVVGNESAYRAPTNVVITPMAGSNAFKVDFDVLDGGGQVYLQITNLDPGKIKDNIWSVAASVSTPTSGRYSYTFTGVSDQNARWFRLYQEGGSKTPSAKTIAGPASLSGVVQKPITPTLLSAAASSDASSVQLNYNLNSTDLTNAFIYRSEDGVAFDLGIQIQPSSSQYTDQNVVLGKTYSYKLQTIRNGIYSDFSDVKSVTVQKGAVLDPVCQNLADVATGGYAITTKSYNISFQGTVFYMFDSGQIPDKITVRKNGITVASYDPISWRIAGSIAVQPGDKLDFVIDPTVTADRGTAWTLYANCNTPYNVNAAQPNQDYKVDDYPRIASVSTVKSGSTRTFTIEATPSINTKSPIVQWKALRKTEGNSYTHDTKWSTSNTLTRDHNNTTLYADEKYVIYVKDAAGRVFGLAEVDASKSYENPIASTPLQLSINQVTASQVVVNVLNPTNGGTIGYNWAIYRKDGSPDGKYVYSEDNVPGTSTLTVNTSKAALSSGETYFLYAAENRGARENQIRNTRIEFTQPGGSDNPGGDGTSYFNDNVVPSNLITNVPNQMVYVENQNLKVGFDLGAGGSIRYLSPAGSTENMVNNFDLGRQLQYAYYGWPIPWYPGDHKPHDAWKTMGWDPIQTGDMVMPSRVVHYAQSPDKTELYVRTIPQMWGYFALPCECHVDTYYKVKGKVIEQTNILYNHRTDDYNNLPRGQDIAGGFLNSPYYRFQTYLGDKPFTGQPVSDKDITVEEPGYDNNDEHVNHHFWSSENWVRIYRPDKGIGLGMWSPSAKFSVTFGGQKNKPGATEYDGDFGSIGTHMFMEHIDPYEVLKYKAAYVLGSVDDIRSYAQSRRKDTYAFNFDFSKDRQHWWTNGTYKTSGGSTQATFPGYWGISYQDNWSNFCSPEVSWSAADYDKVELTFAQTGGPSLAAFNLHKHRDNGYLFNGPQGPAFDDVLYTFPIINDGQFHTYTIDLKTNPNYGGTIIRMYLDFGGNKEPGRYLKLKSIRGYKDGSSNGGGGDEESDVKEVNPLSDVSLSAVPTYSLPAGAINMTADAVPWVTQVDYAKRGMVNYVNPGRLATERGGIYHPDWNPNGITEAALQQELASYNLPANISLYRMMYANSVDDIWPEGQSAPTNQQALNDRIEGFAIGYRNSLGWPNHPIILDIDFEQERFFTYAGVKAQAEAIKYLLSRNANVRVQVYASAHNNLGVDRGGSASNPHLQISPGERFRIFKEAGVSLFQGTIPYFHVPSFFWTDPSHEPSVIGSGKMYASQADYAKKSLHPIVAKLDWTDKYFASIPAGHQPANIEWIMAIYEGGDDGGPRQYDQQGNWISGLNWPEVGGWILESLPVWGVVTGSYRWGGGVYNWSEGRPRKVGQDYLEAGKWRAYQFNRFSNYPNTQYNIKLEYSLDGGISWQTDARPDQTLLAEHQNQKPYVRGAYQNGELLIVAVAGQPFHVSGQTQAIKVRYQSKQFSLTLQSQKVHSLTVTL